jgi:hypothetical protein
VRLLNKHTNNGNTIMPSGILPERLRKAIFVLGVMMMTIAGAMDQLDPEAQVNPDQCAMNLKGEISNHG